MGIRLDSLGEVDVAIAILLDLFVHSPKSAPEAFCGWLRAVMHFGDRRRSRESKC
jgi:hypothetical protein